MSKDIVSNESYNLNLEGEFWMYGQLLMRIFLTVLTLATLLVHLPANVVVL